MNITLNSQNLANTLYEYGIDKDNVQTLLKFEPRNGLKHMEDAEFVKTFKAFNQYTMLDKLIPILTDGRNYVCVYKTTLLKGTVCSVLHDAASYEPKFSSILSFMEFLAVHPECKEIYDLDEYIEDYELPFKAGELYDLGQEAVRLLQGHLAQARDEFERAQVAYSLMAITPEEMIEEVIYPFLEDENWDIQERAIMLMGYLNHAPAASILERLRDANLPNNNSAVAKWALDRINGVCK